MHYQQKGLIDRRSATAARHTAGLPAARPVAAVFDDLLERIGLTSPLGAFALGSLLFLLYILSIYADGYEEALSRLEWWRANLEPVTILVYVLLIHRLLDTQGRRAFWSVRPIVALDDAELDTLVAGPSRAALRNQALCMAISAGVSLLLLESWEWNLGFRWSALAGRALSIIEYAALGSVIYLIVARNAFFTKLFRQPLDVDVFNPAPVNPMGRWGLSVSAAIMGGVTISALLVGNMEDIVTFEHLPGYIAGTTVAVLSFFVSLSSTHRVLLRAKERELGAIRANLSKLYAQLKEGITPEPASTIATWLAYEKRVAEAQEWPYTANTLRGLFATVLLPVFVTVIQQIILWL